MGSSDEMYQLGTQDAELEELNAFYYQHYYHYRRGYDETRRRIRRQASLGRLSAQQWSHLLWLALLLVSLGGGGWLFMQNQAAEKLIKAGGNLPPVATSFGPPAPTRITSTLTLTPPPPLPPKGLHIGGQAQIVNLGKMRLLARRAPGINQAVQASLADGTQVNIIDGPIEADGYTWWLINQGGKGGWSAESRLDGVVWLQP